LLAAEISRGVLPRCFRKGAEHVSKFVDFDDVSAALDGGRRSNARLRD
jgi:hypothetical protein